MPDNSVPQGIRFSLLYLNQGSNLTDSERMRRRLAALFNQLPSMHNFETFVETELGVRPSASGYSGQMIWINFFENRELRDVLDIITLIWRTQVGVNQNRWLVEARRIFQEEGLQYQIDSKGGVHFNVDQAFESSRLATINLMGLARYSTVRNLFEGAHAFLDTTPIDSRAAIRGTFDAVESLFKLMFPKVPRLGASELAQHLQPVIQTQLSSDPIAMRVAQKTISAFAGWVDAAHFYRHAPGTEEPTPPPIELTVVLMSQATAFLRWLISIDARVLKN